MNQDLKPKLRFPEFNGDTANSYKKHLFIEIFRFSTGRNIKQNEASPEFEIPCVRYGELYHMYNEVVNVILNKTNLNHSELIFSEGDEILLPSAGEDPLDIGSASALTLKNIAIGRTINILKPLKANVYSQIYASYYINHKLRKKISTLAKGVSISNVYNSDLKTLEIILPKLLEQHKVASFLSAIENHLQLLEKKKKALEKYKKGVMKKIFDREIRFKDEKGNEFPQWGHDFLFKLADIVKGQQLNKEFLTCTGSYPAQNGGIEPSGYTEDYNTDENTITISEGGNSCGFVNFMKVKFWCGGHCYTLLNLNEIIIQNYLYQYLKFNQDNLMSLRVGSGLPNIQKNDLSKFKVIIPKVDEQVKIASFLTDIDSQINLLQCQIDKFIFWKKGLLQQMFV